VSPVIKIQEVFRLAANGKVLKVQPSTPSARPRDFSTYEDALAFGAALLETGMADEIEVRKVYRTP
jgi:hypothetical protein